MTRLKYYTYMENSLLGKLCRNRSSLEMMKNICCMIVVEETLSFIYYIIFCCWFILKGSLMLLPIFYFLQRIFFLLNDEVVNKLAKKAGYYANNKIHDFVVAIYRIYFFIRTIAKCCFASTKKYIPRFNKLWLRRSLSNHRSRSVDGTNKIL